MKDLRIDELLNSLTARKISWTEKETRKYIYIMTEDKGQPLKYTIDKNNGFLVQVRKIKTK